MQIPGGPEIKGYAGLSPMAGTADLAFRELCREYGAGWGVSEMVSAKGLCMGDRKSAELMNISGKDRPCAIQLFGSDPETVAEAAVKAMEYSPDCIDINMGCPVPKIVRGGAGSALMADEPLAGRIIEAVVRAVNVPVTVKFRTGRDSEHINAVSFAKMCQLSGAAALTIHGRTAAQMYSPPVDTEAIALVKKAVTIPVIANGDIFTALDALNMYRGTGCDYVAVGRGALGRPWIFAEINALLSGEEVPPEPSTAEKMAVMLRHAGMICALKGERHGICEVRKHALWYTKGIRGSAAFRLRLSEITSLDQLSGISEEIIISDREGLNKYKNELP